jgi:two-component system nitrate/nitrite response regulator NarL
MTWWKNLTPREGEVALLAARGLSNKAVAHELGISDGTVKSHMHSIFEKLGTKNRYNLIILAGSPDAA